MVEHSTENRSVGGATPPLGTISFLAANSATGRPLALRFLATKAKFYEILLAGAGNEILAGNLRNLHIRVSQLRAVSLTKPGRGRESIVEIRAMLTALLARDPEAAWNTCTFHVERASEVALALLATNEPLPDLRLISAPGG